MNGNMQHQSRMGRAQRATAGIMMLSALAFGSGAQSGCAGSDSDGSVRQSMRSRGGGDRPMVAQSAVSRAKSSGEDALLAFFDDLETRPLASHDDAIHSCLLLGVGQSAESYEQRVGAARQLGYVSPNFDRPGNEASTIGEVSQMLLGVLEGQRPENKEVALQRLVRRGIAPATARVNQGLTGAQLVSLVGGIRDAMQTEGVKRTSMPTTPAEMTTSLSTASVALGAASAGEGVQAQALPSAVTTGARGIETEASPAASTSGPFSAPMTKGDAQGMTGRAEPLPNIPLGTPPPAIEVLEPGGRPSVIGPEGRIVGGPIGTSPQIISPAGSRPSTGKSATQANPPATSNARPARRPVPARPNRGSETGEPSPWTTGQPVRSSTEETKAKVEEPKPKADEPKPKAEEPK